MITNFKVLSISESLSYEMSNPEIRDFTSSARNLSSNNELRFNNKKRMEKENKLPNLSKEEVDAIIEKRF